MIQWLDPKVWFTVQGLVCWLSALTIWPFCLRVSFVINTYKFLLCQCVLHNSWNRLGKGNTSTLFSSLTLIIATYTGNAPAIRIKFILLEPLPIRILSLKNLDRSQMWWFTPVIPALGRLKQQDQEFEVSPGYIGGPVSKKRWGCHWYQVTAMGSLERLQLWKQDPSAERWLFQKSCFKKLKGHSSLKWDIG
jgi:hypothetical protein